MLTKIYIASWFLLAVVAAALYVTGNLTEPVVVLLGFFAFGMVFMGMISVLPTAVHDSLTKH